MKTRYRVQTISAGLFASKTVLVLQVWRTWAEGQYDHNGAPTHLAGGGWRDAQVQDLSELVTTEPKVGPV